MAPSACYPCPRGRHRRAKHSPAWLATLVRDSLNQRAVQPVPAGNLAPNDGVHRWMGSLAMDSRGDMALGYSVVNGTNVYPGIRYTGRLAGDALGQLTLGEGTIINGTGVQRTTNSRWGDYTSMNRSGQKQKASLRAAAADEYGRLSGARRKNDLHLDCCPRRWRSVFVHCPGVAPTLTRLRDELYCHGQFFRIAFTRYSVHPHLELPPTRLWQPKTSRPRAKSRERRGLPSGCAAPRASTRGARSRRGVGRQLSNQRHPNRQWPRRGAPPASPRVG